MLLLPIGRDESEIRRHAWVSYTIIAMNILCFVASHIAIARMDVASLDARWNEIVEQLTEHPYLVPPEGLRAFLTTDDLAYLENAREEWRKQGGWTLEARAAERLEQRKLQGLVDELRAAVAESPFHRYGYKPSEGGADSIVSSMFLHADIWHLLGNLLFFFVTGPFLEDVFGRPLFAFLYASGGVIATLTHAAKNVGSDVPLIGASGAVAAIMGAYLIRFARSRFEFIWIPIIFLPKLSARFMMPAFIVLPLWFGSQYYLALQESVVSSVAFWAHVGGFGYGMFVGVIVVLTGLEKNFINPAIEGKTTWKQNEHLARASEARGKWDYAGALREIEVLLKTEPNNVDAHLAGFEIAVESDDQAAFSRYSVSLLDAFVRNREHEAAAEHVREAMDVHGLRVPERFLARAAQLMERTGSTDDAVALHERLVREFPDTPEAFRSLVQLGRLYRLNGDPEAARLTLRKARQHSACTGEWIQTLDAQL